MPSTLTYPGVYIEEIPSGVRTIIGVATSITAFIGRALRGPTDDPVTINGFGDFERIFGGLWAESSLGYAVRDFYRNGGGQAIIVRLFHTDDTPGANQAKTSIAVGDLLLEAASPGAWGENLRVRVDTNVSEDVANSMNLSKADLFNLTIQDVSPNGRIEQFRNLTVQDKTCRIDKVLLAESSLVRWQGAASEPIEQWPNVDLSLPDIPELEKKLAAAKKADPPNAEAIKTAEAELNTANAKLADGVTQAEQKLAAAKKADPRVAEAITTAETALQTAKADRDTSNGLPLTAAEFTGPGKENAKQGLYALRKADLFNILCIPPHTLNGNIEFDLIASAAAYCEHRRAMLLVDPPSEWKDKDKAKAGVADLGTNSKNAALFFPRLRQPNPLRDNQIEDFAPCGAVAGVFARTDTQRGVWKAPAGTDATLVGVPQLSVPLTDNENGELNPLGINCLRTMPAAGRVIWGARTLQGDDRLASEWKYIPIRRLALFIEESLYRGTQWVVFEPNDEPLWGQIRLNVGAFMHNLFRKGAFQGSTPRDAYFVKCDRETTPQVDVDSGIVNIVVGFAPLKPAEFVVIKLQQMAGQIDV